MAAVPGRTTSPTAVLRVFVAIMFAPPGCVVEVFSIKTVRKVFVVPTGKVLSAHAAIVVTVAAAGFSSAAFTPIVFGKMPPAHLFTPAHRNCSIRARTEKVVPRER